MNPISLVRLHMLFLPSPRGHWSAIGHRSKTHPIATRHTQRKHTRPSYWHLKPVRPVSEIGQTASVGLSLPQAGETGQTGLINGSCRFCLETPQKHLRDQNTPRTFPPLNKRRHSTIEAPLLKTLHDSPQG
jgi:hypothetical protein